MFTVEEGFFIKNCLFGVLFWDKVSALKVFIPSKATYTARCSKVLYIYARRLILFHISTSTFQRNRSSTMDEQNMT